MATMTMEESFVLVNSSIADMSQKMAAARQDTEVAIKAARLETEEAIKTARQETERVRQETERVRQEMERDRQKSDLALKESHREAEEALKAARQETERVRQETELIRRETERITQKANQAQQKLTDEINKWVGFYGNTIGNVIELILIPGIKKKMNELGHRFYTLSPRKQYYHADGREITEVDLFLEDGDEVMAIEVKTQLSVKEVKRHLKRLELLRKHELTSGLKNKVLRASVAGLAIDKDARELASSLGMYIVEIFEDESRINVIKPESELGKW